MDTLHTLPFDAILAVGAAAAVHTPEAYYHAPDLDAYLPGLTAQKGVSSAYMLAVGALNGLRHNDTIEATFEDVSRAGTPLGTWTATLHRQDLPAPDGPLPVIVDAHDPQALRTTISAAMDTTSQTLLVDPQSRIVTITKIVDGRALSTAEQGLMHTCCSFNGQPEVGFTTTGRFWAAGIGTDTVMLLTVSCTRTA